ncbi:transporter substrate-binding domain-containing protein [Bdellovibrio sp. BCCA]|uniref:transporter substrate-binding domain-containing protein n=1 Tax=Bdellovibrio sp. BCCA TaxID=3136281 RepID=UPI0030F162DD
MKRILFAWILTSTVLGFSTQTWANTISFRSDYSCPYVCNPDSARPGYMVEIVRQVFEKQGYKVEVKISTWVRALKDTRNNKAQALLGSNQNDAPDFIFSNKSLGLLKNARPNLKDSEPFLYVGFSPNNPKSKIYAKILNQGIDDLRRSGELRRILEKYNLEDWEKPSSISLSALNDFRPSFFKGTFDLFNMFNAGSL